MDRGELYCRWARHLHCGAPRDVWVWRPNVSKETMTWRQIMQRYALACFSLLMLFANGQASAQDYTDTDGALGARVFSGRANRHRGAPAGPVPVGAAGPAIRHREPARRRRQHRDPERGDLAARWLHHPRRPPRQYHQHDPLPGAPLHSHQRYRAGRGSCRCRTFWRSIRGSGEDVAGLSPTPKRPKARWAILGRQRHRRIWRPSCSRR